MLHAYIIQPRKEVISAFMELGYRVTQILQTRRPTQATFHEKCGSIVVSNIGNPFELADAISQQDPTVHGSNSICIGLGDLTSLVASVVNELLGVDKSKFSPLSNLFVLKNKPLLRGLLSTSLPEYSGYFRVVHSVDEIKDAFRRVPSGLVVKPLDGSGSLGVFRLLSEDDIMKDSARFSFPALAEEFFSGSEFSVEVMTIDGQHQPLAVTQKVLGGESGVVEVGQIQPADIDEATRLCLMDAATSLLDTIQFRFGLSHTEIILDGDTPKIVESHGRVGGDRIADLLRFTTGYDAFERLGFAILKGQFLPIEPIASSSRIDFVNLMDYRGSDQEWKEALLSEPNVYSAEVMKPAGDRGPIWCSADRHAFVLSAFERKAQQ